MGGDAARVAVAIWVCVLFGGAGMAHASIRVADVARHSHLRLVGAPTSTYEGSSVAGAGDVNGDGRPDFVVGAAGSDANGRRDSGSAFVVFGRAQGGTVDLARLGADGLRIDGPPPEVPVELDPDGPAGARAGVAVAALGDVDGDGLGDIAIGVPRASPRGRAFAGSVYVVFGRRTPATVDLATAGPADAWRIDGAQSFDQLGYRLAGAGDVNGDGRPDLVVSAQREVFVVLGTGSREPVDLAALGQNGYRIRPRPGTGTTVDSGLGPSVQLTPANTFPVAGAGDVNGDGRADVIVGTPATGSADVSGDEDGAAFVVFGQATASDVDLTSLGARGQRFDGAGSGGLAGQVVAGAGDVNSDGLADVLIGAPDFNAEAINVPSEGSADNGAAYVVFGRRGSRRLNLRRLGRGGIRIAGEEAGDRAGTAVAAAGDVNGDGRGDVLVGAPGADGGCRAEAGAAYVVLGGPPGRLRLSSLGRRGYRLDGRAARDALATQIAAPGAGGTGAVLAVPAGRPNAVRPVTYDVLDLPAPRAVRSGLPIPACLVVELLPARLGDLVAGGSLRVRMTAREATGRRRYVDLVVYIAENGIPDSAAVVAQRRVRFLRPGTRILRFRVPRAGRRVLAARSRARFALIAVQEMVGRNQRWRYDGLVARR